MNQIKTFADGFTFEKPRQGAPEFVKGHIHVNASKAIAFLEQHKNARGWVKLDIKKSLKGVLYMELDTWQPKTEVKEEVEEEISF